jgi:transcriptional regulator with XRE-family HTH domain
MTVMTAAPPTRPGVGSQLREWRTRRRLSQLELALEAGVSARHVSFIETGRSRPSAEMVLHLADRLEVPLRERNQLLLAAGHAPRYSARSLADPELAAVRSAVSRVLAAHEPYPALAVDRAWNLVASNGALGPLLDGVSDWLLAPPVNVLRLALHPEGLAPRVLNLGEWRGHLLHRLDRQLAVAEDPGLRELRAELGALPGPQVDLVTAVSSEVAVELRLAAPGGELAFISTVTTFGTALDVTVSELSIEAFLPADAATADALRRSASPS